MLLIAPRENAIASESDVNSILGATDPRTRPIWCSTSSLGCWISLYVSYIIQSFERQFQLKSGNLCHIKNELTWRACTRINMLSTPTAKTKNGTTSIIIKVIGTLA